MSTRVAESHGLLGRLAEVATKVGTGVITAVRGKHRRLFCFENGELIYAASNVIEEQFNAALVRQNVLLESDVHAASMQAKAAGKKLGEYLREQGEISDEKLATTMAVHARELLVSTSNWSDAEFNLSQGRPNLGGEPTTRLPVSDLLIQLGRRTSLTADKLRVLIGPPNVRPQRSKSARTARIVHGELAQGVLDLVDLCNGTRSLAELVKAASGSEVDTLGTLYALTLLGVLKGEEVAAAETDDGGVGRPELRAVLDNSRSSDHYGILGLNVNATASAIRDAYYYLARRFHPDRFRTGPLVDMREQVESYFAKVTEAYNTLHDANTRAQFDLSQEQKSSQKEPEQDPDYLARVNFLRAKALVDKRRFQEAVKFLENAIQLDASNPNYHLELGRVLAMNPRRRADAESSLKAAIELDPTLIDTYLVLGDLYLRTQRADDAAEMFLRVLNWDPANADALRELKQLGASPDQRAGGILRGLFRG